MEFDYNGQKFLENLNKVINEAKLPLTMIKYMLVDVINQLNVQIDYNIQKYKKALEEKEKEQSKTES